MSHWNHRVMRMTTEQGEVIDQIHEVYYKDDGTVDGWTQDGVSPCFYVDEEDGQETMVDELKRFMRATTMPTLDFETGKEIR